MTRSLLLSVLACCLTWAQASAQDVDDSRPAPTNVRGAEYPRIHSDNRVTFRLKAPEARKVQLQPNDGAVENGLGKGPYNMVRGSLWRGFRPTTQEAKPSYPVAPPAGLRCQRKVWIFIFLRTCRTEWFKSSGTTQS